MKKLILLLAVVSMTFTAQASSYVDYLKGLSWSELRANWDVDFEGDQVWFGGRIVDIFDTCMINDTTIRTNSKVKIEEMDGDDFVVVGFDYLYKSIHTSRAVVDGDSVIDEPYTMSTTRTIRVVENDDDFQGDLLFRKEFTIPACK